MEGMKGTLADFDIIAITETPIMDVYKVKLGDAPKSAEAAKPE